MNKKIIQITRILLIVVFLLSICVNSFALEPKEVQANKNVNGTTEIANVGNSIVGILQTVGIVLSVVILIILGIKYMMGSSEEKAEYKKTMIPYIVGAGFIFAASALAQVVYQFFNGISSGS